MTEEKKQSEEITQAGAVELEENALDEAAGGVLSVGDIKIGASNPAQKFSPEYKYSGDFHIKF